MPTQAPQRPAFREQYRYYGSYSQARSTSSKVYDFPPVRPRPQVKPRVQIEPKQNTKAVPQKRTSTWKVFVRIALVVGMCMLMLYRYAAILESNDKIQKLTAEIADIEAKNQAIQAKIDRGLELGNLEEYATGQLGMIRPDSSQMFYIDMQLGDETPKAKEANHTAGKVLQGTPGALVHAIQVLK